MFSHSQSRLRSRRIFVSCTFQMQLHAKTQICTLSLIRNLKVHETTKDLKVVWMMQFCDRDLFGKTFKKKQIPGLMQSCKRYL